MKKNELILIGCDVATQSPNAQTSGVVGIVAIRYPKLEIIRSSFYPVRIEHSYQTGFLAKREGEVMTNSLKSFLEDSQEQLDLSKIVTFIDGSGQLHPRKHGLACHVGKQIDYPTIGITKTYLIGEEKTATARIFRNNGFTCKVTEMWLNGELSGWKVRKVNETNKKPMKPIYVSVGWSIPLEKALLVTIGTMKHRIPEPIRLADHLARQQLRAIN